MKKIMNPTIEIAPDFLLRQFGWAFRYCANRSSYAVSDCIDMALYIHHNRDKFNPERVKFQARDLRNEANNRLSWNRKNVRVNNNGNDCADFAAYDQIAKYLIEHPDIRFCDYDWTVYCDTGRVTLTKRKEPHREPYEGLAKLYDMDIATVCQAADIIDPDKHYMVTTLYNGHEETKECIKSIIAEQVWDEERHITVDYKYSEVYRIVTRPHSWAAPEFITKIEKI